MYMKNVKLYNRITSCSTSSGYQVWRELGRFHRLRWVALYGRWKRVFLLIVMQYLAEGVLMAEPESHYN